MMNSWTRALAFSLACCVPTLSAAAPGQEGRPTRSPAASGFHAGIPVKVEKDRVAVAVQLLDAEHSQAVFDVDLLRRGIQPLVIEISNHSGTAYRFTKAHVDAQYIPADRAARYSYPNPVITTLRLAWWLVSFVPVMLFAQSVTEAANRRPTMNRDVRRDYAQGEITDATISPNGTLTGMLFIAPRKPGTPLTITLLNASTQEPLVFEVPTQHEMEPTQH